MNRRGLLIIVSLVFILSLHFSAYGFMNNKENYDRDKKEFIEYTQENIDSGKIKGGHDTVTSEAMKLKKEVHGNDLQFQEWAKDGDVFPYLRAGAWIETS